MTTFEITTTNSTVHCHTFPFEFANCSENDLILDVRVRVCRGATENAGVENAIRAKLQGWKMQEWKKQE